MVNRVVTREEWQRERISLLEAEKEMLRSQDAFRARRQALPWVEVEREYLFEGEAGSVPFEALFRGRSQLIVYHFMFGADWKAGCPSCSLWTDGFQGAIPHLEQRDVSFATVSTADYSRLSRFRERMGWEHEWYSAEGPDFGRDFLVSYSDDEIEKGETFYNYRTGHHYGTECPGLSVFCRDDGGKIFHTYSCYARGLETVGLFYAMIDLVPKGRDEGELSHPMAWIALRDEYS